jgi:ubiquinone/menaquinone biosynthesis C-methylase UbiE
VEHFAQAWSLPFPDDWAEEILAIHVLEHVPPPRLAATLGEWRRVLRPGGKLRISVPDSAALMRAFLDASEREKWSLIGALLGMYANPSVWTPDQLCAPADHQVLFDEHLLRSVLLSAGFTEFRNRSDTESDVHTEGWRPLIPQISIIAEVRKPGGANGHRPA